MTSGASTGGPVARIRQFAQTDSGTAAIEFAALLPFMLIVYIGGVELGDAVAIDRKVAVTTRTVADLATQYTTIANGDSSTILGAASAILAPYSSANLGITVSLIAIDANGRATVAWSDTSGGTALTAGAQVTLPGTCPGTSCLAQPSTYLIFGQASYAYTPTLGYVISGTINMSDEIFMSPRQSACISRNPGYTCP
jgi:Flp pilus assembly protein TadG